MRIPALILLISLCGSAPACAQLPAQIGAIHCEADISTRRPDVAALEAKCLSRMKGIAVRRGEALRISLQDGKTKSLLSNNRACEEGNAEKCVDYRLEAYYPDSQLFVLTARVYESYSVLVVNGTTGTTTNMDDSPHLSPNGERLVVAFSSEAWSTDRDIAVYRIENGALRLEWSYKAKGYEQWKFVAWDGDARIKLRVTLYGEDQSSGLTTRDADLRRTDAGWRLNKHTRPSPKPAAVK